MELIIGSARIDENGKIMGGKAGDQTGREVCTQPYYMHKYGWICIRPKTVELAKGLAKSMKSACDNDNVGYCQTHRSGIVEQTKKYGSISEIETKTEADCGTTVRACCIDNGFDPGNFSTANAKTVLYESDKFEKPFEVTDDTVLYNGDILVTKTKGHIVIVVSGNPRSAGKSDTSYYKKYVGTSQRVDDIFKSIGVPAKYRGSYSNRKPVANANGITSYGGTMAQNLQLITLAKQGKLRKVK